MRPELSPAAVAARLARLRTIATLEPIEVARERLTRDQPPPLPFAEAVGRRLSDLRALYDLTLYLHRGRS